MAIDEDGKYKYRGLNGLDKELKNTAVISEEFKSAIYSWVFLAVNEAYDHGRQVERERNSEGE